MITPGRSTWNSPQHAASPAATARGEEEPEPLRCYPRLRPAEHPLLHDDINGQEHGRVNQRVRVECQLEEDRHGNVEQPEEWKKHEGGISSVIRVKSGPGRAY